MPAQIVDQIQARLVTLLSARSGLAVVQVSDGFSGQDEVQPERIFTGDARSLSVVPSGLRAGRTFYSEEAETDVVIQVLDPDGTPAQVKARALALASEVAECIADNRQLAGTGAALSGLNWIRSDRWTLQTMYGQTGAIAEIIHTLKYSARLT